MSCSSPELLTLKDLRGYQRWMAERIEKEPFLLLGSFMGSGKTIAVLTALRKLLDGCVVNRVLIVAPLLVAEETWTAEIEAWAHTRVLSYEVLTGSAERRLARLQKPAEIHIINRENLVWLWKQVGAKTPYDMIVYDESSRLKGGRKRTAITRKNVGGKVTVSGGTLSEFGALCNLRKHASRAVALTGTPAPNGVADLWGQVYFLDQGERLGATRGAFEDRWFVSDFLGFKKIARPHAEREIMERVSDIMVALKEADYADLPPLVKNIVESKLRPKELKQYNDFVSTLVAEEFDVEAVSRGVLTNKALQFANGALYKEDGSYVVVHDAKIKALERIISEAAGQPILVAYSFKFDLEQIKKAFPHAVVLTDNASVNIRGWNAGKIPLLLAHPASCGHGLNLQQGGNIAVWYGMNWSLELYQQFNKRLHRGGQKRTVFLHHILTPGTLDFSVMEALNQKDATQQTVIDAVKVSLLESVVFPNDP